MDMQIANILCIIELFFKIINIYFMCFQVAAKYLYLIEYHLS